jgi:hypothetical protein
MGGVRVFFAIDNVFVFVRTYFFEVHTSRYQRRTVLQSAIIEKYTRSVDGYRQRERRNRFILRRENLSRFVIHSLELIGKGDS